MYKQKIWKIQTLANAFMTQEWNQLATEESYLQHNQYKVDLSSKLHRQETRHNTSVVSALKSTLSVNSFTTFHSGEFSSFLYCLKNQRMPADFYPFPASSTNNLQAARCSCLWTFCPECCISWRSWNYNK